MREIVLDTETTGLEPDQGHRIIEVACVEILDRRMTGEVFQKWVNPERDSEEGAYAVHRISDDFLRDKPVFRDIWPALREFVAGAQLVIHNAEFDLGFLDAELRRLGPELKDFLSETDCGCTDTLLMAREKYPGARNNLDALCERHKISAAERAEGHSAIVDARLLAQVYLAMTGGQTAFSLEVDGAAEEVVLGEHLPTPVLRADEDELRAHEEFLDLLDKQAGRPCVWRARD